MSKRIARTVLRMNLEREADRRAWEYLQRLDRKAHKSYSHAVITAINDFFGRQERLLNDAYLETREKEDAFLQRVLEAIAKGVQEAAALGTTGGMRTSLQGITATNTASVSATDAEREASIDAALDFANSL
jgi:AcrR family transcriptional regulator